MDLRYPFLTALREALNSSFHLPGEAEQIDRIVQTWAFCWVAANPDSTLTGESAYVLAFAVVMLNSDLHNPQVKHRMTVEKFISNLRGALGIHGINDAELTQIYESIRDEQFTLKHSRGDEFLALSGPRLRGTLAKKRSNFFSVWTTHYFVLTEGCLYYFKDNHESSEDVGPLGVIQLVNVDIQPVQDNKIQITSTEGSLQYVKFEKRKPPEMVKDVSALLLKAPSTKTRDKWLYRIKTSYVHATFTGEVGTTPLGDLKSVSEATPTTLTEGELGRSKVQLSPIDELDSMMPESVFLDCAD
jgi:hypothetical protein